MTENAAFRQEISAVDHGKIEDDQIQSSLPFYLDHLFGQCVGKSQSQSQANAHTSSPLSGPILDSQGFLTSSKNTTSSKNVTSHTPPLIDLSSLPLVETRDNVPAPEEGLANSPVLFPSPDPSDTYTNSVQIDTQDHQNSNSKPILEQETTATEITISDIPIAQMKYQNTVVTCNKTSHPSEKPKLPLTNKPKRGKKRKLSTGGDKDNKYVCPPSATSLRDCSLKQGVVSVLAIVVQVNPVMDVSCKVGDMAGQTVPMSSLLLADPTKSYFKLSLWRQAAMWVERISAGDIIYFRKIRLKIWRSEVVATTTMYSSVLNLHQPRRALPPQVSCEVPEESLSSLVQWGHKFFGYLFNSLPPKFHRTVEFVSSDLLAQHSLIHFRARLMTMVTDKVLILSDAPDKEFYLYLVGVNSSLWSDQLRSGVGKVWEFTYLTTSPDSLTQGGCTLYTTSRSQLRVLDSDCQVSAELLKLFPLEGDCNMGLVTKGMSIADILLSKSTGVYQVKGRAEKVEFIGIGVSVSLESLCQLSPSSLVENWCQNCIYVGCGSCSNPLSQDENGVYRQCMPCLLSRSRDQQPGFLYYYRMLAVTLRDDSGCSVVMATHVISPKVLSAKPVESVHVSLSKNSEKMADLKRALNERLCCLLECDSVWIVSLGVAKDENSFLCSMAVSLLDWSCTNHPIT